MVGYVTTGKTGCLRQVVFYCNMEFKCARYSLPARAPLLTPQHPYWHTLFSIEIASIVFPLRAIGHTLHETPFGGLSSNGRSMEGL